MGENPAWEPFSGTVMAPTGKSKDYKFSHIVIFSKLAQNVDRLKSTKVQ